MTEKKLPAYKEPWFWFVFSPLIIVVFVAFTLLWFAVVGGDDRVNDDYYKQGRMINNRFAAEQLARDLNVSGTLDFDHNAGTVTVSLDGQSRPEHISMLLSHPAKADKDTTLVLSRRGGSLYQGYLEEPLTGRWYVLLESVAQSQQETWRVGTEINFDQTAKAGFKAVLPERKAAGQG